MFARDFAIAPKIRCLAHRDAYRIWNTALVSAGDQTITLDLSDVEEITTSAFARLVLLRRELRRNGGDLQLMGLHDLAERLYEVNRLDGVLPRC